MTEHGFYFLANATNLKRRKSSVDLRTEAEGVKEPNQRPEPTEEPNTFASKQDDNASAKAEGEQGDGPGKGHDNEE